MEEIRRDDLPFRPTRALLGEEPALLFFGHGKRDWSKVFQEAALFAYHSAIEWGVITNFAETVVFNSHWIKAKDWFRLPAFKARDIAQRLEILEALTPDGLKEGRIEHLAYRHEKPDSILVPVDDNLVDCLDSWRDEALKYALKPSESDRKLQNLFAQLFVLRAIEDRRLSPRIPTLESALSEREGVLWQSLREIFAAARVNIQSELFDTTSFQDFPAFVISGIIHDLYRPRDLPIGGIRYNFAWINSDVLGRAYEKYLSTVLVPYKKPIIQMDFFQEPMHQLRRVTQRKARGVYYTPEYVVRYLTEGSLNDYFENAPKSPVRIPRIADISCGSGSFLTAAADSLIRRLRQVDRSRNWGRELVSKHALVGADVDHKAVTLARLSLWLRLAEEPNPLPLPRLNGDIICGDSLASEIWQKLHKRYDIILGNPPFASALSHPGFRRTGKSFRAALGRFDYSSLFIEKAVHLLKPGGLIGYVVPNRLLQNASAAPIRQVLTEKMELLAIVDFGNSQVFSGTSSYVALIRARRKIAKAHVSTVRVVRMVGVPDRFPGAALAIGTSSRGDVSTTQVVAYDARHPVEHSPWLLLAGTDLRFRVKLENSGKPLSTVAQVLQGIKTGANDVFVVQIERAASGSLCVVLNGFGETHFVESALLRPVVYGSEIRRYETIEAARFMIYPYAMDTAIDEQSLQRHYPRTYDYLVTYREYLSARSGIEQAGSIWYELVRRRNVSWLESSKILSRELATEPAFAIDKTGSTFLIGGIAIVPMDSALLDPLLGFLNSHISAKYLSQVSPPFRGGFCKYEPRNIAELPVPDCITKASDFRDELANLVSERVKARHQADEVLGERIERQIDRMIAHRIGVHMENIR
jgi:SAM-dependent methyltransferase